MNVKRLDNWHIPLKEILKEHSIKEFAWGENDCVTFTCNCIEAQTGYNPKEKIYNYKTERGAARAIKQWNDEGKLDLAFSKLMLDIGLKQVKTTLAQRGNPAAWESPETGVCIGVVDLDPRYALFVARDKPGFIKVKVMDCLTAWRFE